MPEWITPELWPLWCRPGPVSFSSTVIRASGWAWLSARAVARPTMPPPMTAYRVPRVWPPACTALLDGPAAGEGPSEGDLVGVLQVAADRQAAGQPAHGDAHRLDQPGQVGGGRLALQVRVGGQDQLGDRAVGEPVQQLAHPQVVRADAVDGADRPAQHVIATPELPGALDRDDVLGFL